MNMNEIQGDLFKVNEETYLVHCISKDYKMGAGIAIEFNKRYNLRAKLSRINIQFPSCIQIGKVFNLITKEKYWMKPTYETMHISLIALKKLCQEQGVRHLAMPKIGCGLDNLSWNRVKRQLTDVFKDYNIQIDVYFLE